MPDTNTPVPVPADPKNTTQSIITAQYGLEAVKEDISLMMHYAINSGKELPNNISLKEATTEEDLLNNYNTLRKVIAPATVQSIRYINSQWILKGQKRKWYEIPIFTKCVIIAAVALVSLILISLSPIVNEANQMKGLLESSGLVLFFNLLFICMASLLGVMFYLLKTFGDQIRNYTLMPFSAVELNASIIIGVISGFVISELFAFTLGNLGSQNMEFHKMTLALMGGFSADAIFSTLQGIVNKFKNLVTS